MVDGWLLLTRVAPAAARNLKAGLWGYVKNVFTAGASERAVRQIRELSNVKYELEKQLSEVDKILRSKTAAEVDWARPILTDLRDDIGEFIHNANPSRKELVLLQERLDSLTEDLLEDVAFTGKHDFGGMFLEKAKEMFTHGSLAQQGELMLSQTSGLSTVFAQLLK
uniref:Putative sgs family member n=1 Tax=Psorophora albipes TaxID=869069 RepID=T1DIW9_9DIPT